MRQCRESRRGFTLLEIMVASAISLIVLAAALWSAAELQRRGVMEESLMEAQNAMRVVREMLVSELQRAGTGAGSAALVFGRRGDGSLDNRYAIAVGAQETFSGSGLFPRDDTFKPPTGAYAGRISDAVQVWSWDTAAMSDTPDEPLVVTPLTVCRGTTDTYRDGDKLCVSADDDYLRGRVVMVVKPRLRIACIMQVVDVNVDVTTPGANYADVTVAPSMINQQPAASGPCMAAPSAPTEAYKTFWKNDEESGGFLVPLRGVSFRVNWASGQPVLERQEILARIDADPSTQPPWVALTSDVEVMRLRLGVTRDLDSLSYQFDKDTLWFPDDTVSPKRPAIDACRTPADCDHLVPVKEDAPAWRATTLEPTARDALMRRVRLVELQLTTRTARSDPNLVRKEGAAYVLDPDGYPRDGFKRRTSTLEVMPRNYAYAGVLHQ